MPVTCCKNDNQCFSPDRNGILLCWGSAQKIKWIAGLLFLSRTIFSAPKKNTSLSTGACLPICEILIPLFFLLKIFF